MSGSAMVRNSPSSSGAFNSLPIELNKAIAHELDADKDVTTYRLICKATNNAIDADNKSFWRTKFREKYALRKGVSNSKLQRIYQGRAKYLRRGTGYDFFRGNKNREADVLGVLRDLIVDSFQGPFEIDEYGRPVCRNYTHLVNFILNSKILFHDRRATRPSRSEPPNINPMLAAIKLMCFHFLFELKGAQHSVFAIEESQQAVYLATNSAPIYKGVDHTEVNLDWLLHCSNFFRHHMMDEEVATLFDGMTALPVTQRPSAWRGPLRQGTYPLGKHWKGTYSFLDTKEITRIRRLHAEQIGEQYFTDKNVEDGKIQSLELDFIPAGQELRWPGLFENRLHSLRRIASPLLKTQGRSKPKDSPEHPRLKNIQFVGQGEDTDDDFNAIGWLNPLPPQAGIPGWQRITFMKHFMVDIDQLEQDNLWAYEGVVLPGGRIIMGRWWYASEEVDFNRDYNGPFILWAVDADPDAELEDDSDEEQR